MDRRQKKLEKHRKKRKLAQQRARAEVARGQSTGVAILRLAETCPMGPAFISGKWTETREPPPLVTGVITRRLPDGCFLPVTVLVDRTCLGVKDAGVLRPMSRVELDMMLAGIADANEGVEECDPLVVQSVAYHGIDYARSLGFEPCADFSEKLIGPRPERLLDTPFARPERPFYFAGPRDDAASIMAQLDEAVGSGGYHFVVPEEMLLEDRCG